MVHVSFNTGIGHGVRSRYDVVVARGGLQRGEQYAVNVTWCASTWDATWGACK